MALFLRFRTLALALALAASASASEWYASPSAPPGQDGRSPSTPFRTVQQAVNAAMPGDTVHLRGGTFREEVTISKSASAGAPIVITAYASEQPVLKGSLIAAGWTRHQGSIWKRTGWSYRSQQVFVDGVPLQQIGLPAAFGNGIGTDGTRMITPIGSGAADLAPGRFYHDAAASTLYAWLADGGDPNAHLIEASAFKRIMYMGASTFVTVANLTFRHSSTAAYMVGGAAVELGTDCTMRDCDVQWCDFAGVSLGYQQSRAKIVRSVVSNHGCTGISTSASSDFLVSASTMSNNNYRNFNSQWHAGGMKVTSRGWGTVDGCTVSGNRGSGLWFDYASSGNRIVLSRNWIAGNTTRGGGIMLEVTRNASVHDNVIFDNDIRGIYVSACNDIDILANTIVGNRGYHALDVSGMPRSGASLTNVRIIGNCIADNLSQRDLFIVKENGTDIVNLRCDSNLFHRPSGLVLRWSLDGRGGWAGTDYSSLGAWQAATRFDDGSVQGDPRFADAAGCDFRLGATSPGIDRGQALPFTVDYLGLSRSVGAAPDLGAYECSARIPMITSPADAAATVGAWFSYAITASEGPTRFDAAGLPAGLSCDPVSGVISGYPAVGGWFAATISASSAAGAATATLRLSVNAPPTVAMTGPGDGSVVAAPADLVLTAAAEDDRGIARIEFYDGGVKLGDCASAPYAWTWTAPAVGGHAVTACAIDSDGAATMSSAIAVTVQAKPMFATRINFQPATASTVAGWLVDSGAAFGDRDALSYGWNRDTPDTRDRNRLADQLRDTCILMQAAANPQARWEIAVPPGTYQVSVVCGDPSYFDGSFKLDVEGVRTIEGRASSAVPFREGSVTVLCSDGRLTVSNADGSYNTKMCCIEIQQLPAGNG
jgi:parallel beta-helix repeat protein